MKPKIKSHAMSSIQDDQVRKGKLGMIFPIGPDEVVIPSGPTAIFPQSGLGGKLLVVHDPETAAILAGADGLQSYEFATRVLQNISLEMSAALGRTALIHYGAFLIDAHQSVHN